MSFYVIAPIKYEILLFLQPTNTELCTVSSIISGSSSVGRASASQAEGRESESRLPLNI